MKIVRYFTEFKTNRFYLNRYPTHLSDQHQALGCLEDTINLSCEHQNGSLITVTKTFFGQYRQTSPCSDCCAPNPQYDCTETVSVILHVYRITVYLKLRFKYYSCHINKTLNQILNI